MARSDGSNVDIVVSASRSKSGVAICATYPLHRDKFHDL